MSAAAGISAAKKRRGVVSSTPEPSSNNAKQTPQQPVMITPIQILQNHELRLKAIEQQLIVAEEAAADIQQQIQQQKPTTTTSTAQGQTTVQSTLTPSQLEEFTKLKTKCETLEKKVEDMTDLVHKVQTFSMESNLAFLKLKRIMDDDFENRIQELKQSYVSSDDTIMTLVKQDTAAALSSMSANGGSVVEENIHLNVIEQE
jgi:hypothetical protein